MLHSSIKNNVSTQDMARKTAVLLPELFPELLDTIASFIDSRQDLLSFSLACKAFKGVIIPLHTDYRIVRCHYRRHAVWKHFAQHLHLACRVRTVVVFDDFEAAQYLPERFPRVSRHAEKDEKEEDFVDCAHVQSSADNLLAVAASLQNMQQLKRLQWSTSLQFVEQRERRAEAAIWYAVSMHRSLQDVEFMQPINPPTSLPDFLHGIEKYPVSSFCFLKIVWVT